MSILLKPVYKECQVWAAAMEPYALENAMLALITGFWKGAIEDVGQEVLRHEKPPLLHEYIKLVRMSMPPLRPHH